METKGTCAESTKELVLEKNKQDQQTSSQTNQKKEEIMQVNKIRDVKRRIL